MTLVEIDESTGHFALNQKPDEIAAIVLQAVTSDGQADPRGTRESYKRRRWVRRVCERPLAWAPLRVRSMSDQTDHRRPLPDTGWVPTGATVKRAGPARPSCHAALPASRSDVELVTVRVHDLTGDGPGLAEPPIGGRSRRVTCLRRPRSRRPRRRARPTEPPGVRSCGRAWQVATATGSFAPPACGLSRTIGSTGGGLMCSASERGSAVGGCIMSSSSRARFLQPVAGGSKRKKVMRTRERRAPPGWTRS